MRARVQSGPYAVRVHETSRDLPLVHVEAHAQFGHRHSAGPRSVWGCTQCVPTRPPETSSAFSMGPYAVRVRETPRETPRDPRDPRAVRVRETPPVRVRETRETPVSARPARPPCPRDPRETLVSARPSRDPRTQCVSARPLCVRETLVRETLSRDPRTQCVSARPSLSARPSRPFVLATAGRDGMIWLWDLVQGEDVARLPGHKSFVWSLAFSTDGTTLASGSGDATSRPLGHGAVEGSLPGPARPRPCGPKPNGWLSNCGGKRTTWPRSRRRFGPTGR